MSTQPQYGAPIQTGPVKVFGWMPLKVMGTGVIAITLGMFAMLAGSPLLGLGLVLVVFSVLLVGFVPFGAQDRTVVQRLVARFQHAQRVARAETTFISSHMANLAQKEQQCLPGFLKEIVPVKTQDGTGSDVEILHHQAVGMGTVTLACAPVGGASLPQGQLNANVNGFASWLGTLSKDNGLVGASIVVDSMRSSAQPMADGIMETLAPNAPEVSKKILREATGMLPARVSRVRTYATLGWKLSALDDDREGALAEITAKLPGHVSALSAAGSGKAYVMADAHYGDLMYAAYNPAREAEVEQELYDGVRALRHFNGSGPEYINANHKRVVLHDGVASMTAMLSIPDPQKITARTYRSLFEPSKHFLRKRVALFYRPVPDSRQRARIDQAQRGFSMQWSSKKRNTAFDAKEGDVVNTAMKKMTNGAKLQEWCLMVTVTFEANRKAQRAAENELKAIMSGMKWTFADYVPEAAFHQTLPLGIFPWVYASNPMKWMSVKDDPTFAEEEEDGDV